ncbi:MAG: hypothetical protein COV59_05820 [Candidatus Magasanikbacteria bacterium CG11_big_fil_rev_8_21_14_0_20_39_34]|uniref:Uncharacterized protein n=1 Tax=Candidatus Magasanikbacteria bacterium CG11_big_fil_rev_8_21_14_0_20_39_34 TaxID=1974653 RepID=A0A2H0N448_9BACT|nr:MAG: hypothetical protein COV59_05820 [Candidatus Magasanikbacteria bacterium CG11_big_fil_rev_8_21_14_0_20_39_34]
MEYIIYPHKRQAKQRKKERVLNIFFSILEYFLNSSKGKNQKSRKNSINSQKNSKMHFFSKISYF